MNGERSQSTACKTLMAVALLAICFGCDQSTPIEADKTPVAKAAPSTAAIDAPKVLSADELRRQLGTDERAKFRRVGTDIVEVYLAGAGVQSIEALKGLPLRVLDLGFCQNIKDISVLAGMPLKTLILEGTSVADLSPLAGMSLETLHLQDTPVTDLSVLEGMPLKQLNLKGVAVSDVTPFSKMPLSTLWLLETGVSDISPLSALSLESLDLQDTMVSDLSALAHMTTLRRLNIAGTEITDIRPVTGLKLDRIFLSPGEINQGMDALRNIPSLGKIGTSHEHQFPASDFWERYDVGAWGSEKETPTEESAAKPADNLPETIPAIDATAPE
jgi:internalin A